MPPPGSGNVPMPPIYYPPVFPAHPIAGPPEWGHHPAHPIAPGGPPPVAGWTPPGYRPEHPIVLPKPPGEPAHPIVIPPDNPGEPERKFEVRTVWTQQTGWVVVLVPTEAATVPTPS